MNLLQGTAIIFLFTMFSVHCQNVIPQTSTRNNREEEINHKPDNTMFSVYDEDSNCIYINDVEGSSSTNKNADGSYNNYSDSELFDLFIKKFKKEYSNSNKHNDRLQIFKNNLKEIKASQEKDQGTAVFGITKFSDLTTSEFKEMYLGYNHSPTSRDVTHLQQAVIPDDLIPPEFDWRKLNAVTSVKNQGFVCRSCWAFSTVGNVEGVRAVKHHVLESLSPQELVDCDKRNKGCNGGNMKNAFESIMELGGLQTEEDYPYLEKTMNCAFDKTKVKATISGYVNISSDEQEMAQWLYKNAPMSVAVNASSFHSNYCKGVLHPTKDECNPAGLNHAVLIVGYGTEYSSLNKKELPFWIVKNSWGSDWGEKGYIRVYRGDGTCGINSYVTSAIAA